ncbi:MAG TPA: TonB family protein [Silvibacterium sp.]|nr:TonB family protein [Silvibacterium sp.]
MPITEVPTSPPPGAPPEPPRFQRARRYEDYDTHDLLSVIEELEGSRNWVSLREKLWIAIIIHLIVIWMLMYGPKYIFHQRVRIVQQAPLQQKQMTYLETPNSIKPVKPKIPAPAISNQSHVAQSPHPTLDRKTLEELEAMRRAGRPVPKPAPQTPAPKPTQQAQAAPPAAQQPKTPAQPLPANEKSQIEAPEPAPPKPNFNTGRNTPGQDIQEMARNAARSGETGGDMGAGAPSEHPGNNGAVDILSDTMGVDFGPYIQRVIFDTKKAWYPIIPEAAQPPLLKQGRVTIRFKILRDGTVTDMHLEGPSGDVSLDRAAWGGITGAGYPPLPKEFKGKDLELRFMFLYNLRPGQE